MNKCVVLGMSNEDYHSADGISKSGLDLVAKSPLHYWSKYLDPNREQRAQTPAMVTGTAIHAAVLEPDRFATEFRVAPVVDRRTKDGKASWEAFILDCEANELTPISQDDFKVATSIAGVVRSHTTAIELFSAGQAEMSMFWEDPETGVLCKCRPDWMADGNIVVDLKSCQDASPSGFMKSAYSYRYWVQAAWYMDGIERATGKRPDAFVFVAFEKEAPYACGFYYATEEMLEAGRIEYRRNLDLYADSLKQQNWRGYSPELQPLAMPAWFKSE